MKAKSIFALTSTAIMGLSLLASPLASHAQEGSVPVEHKVPASSSTNLEYLKLNETKHTKINKASVLKYKLSITKASELTGLGVLTKVNSTVSLDTKGKIMIDIRDAKGKVVSKLNHSEYKGVKIVAATAHLEKGTYTLEIRGLSNLDDENYELDFIANTEVTAPNMVPIIKSVTASKKGVLPQRVATTVTVKATEAEKYKVEIKYPNAKSYTTVKNFNTKNKYKFASSKVGTHKLRYTVLSKDGVEVSKTINIKVVKAATPTQVKLTKSKTSIIPKAKTKLTTVAKGNNLNYKFAYKLKQDKKYHVIRNYTASNVATFTAPKKKGTYTVKTYVKQTNGTKVVTATNTVKIK
ncbi:hypothetical protein [Rummeliibacillus stabekisii]|uniref:hypothetical protein n=1 Tax=Rummeliibacillus stabekisii TaxID=241244 RepID=UPI0037199BE5